jgi:Fur family ferric uptake transcriptional regulator
VTSTERLRAKGLRATQPRVDVLDVLDAARDTREHLSVALIADRARVAPPTVSTQTVHDCLDAFTGAGPAPSIEPAGHPARHGSRGRRPGCRTPKSID